ncbi:MAG: phospholipid carrier-dependent glycosyltransferase [Oscillochloris sp.]|nr:phospholipid carrier-dependent glycosyltransferase [Oscillochloris sp.]
MKKIALSNDIPARTVSRDTPLVRPLLIWLALGAIVLLALFLRTAWIDRSLPYVDHPDEPNPITYVVEMLRSGDPNQRFFQKPSLFVYLALAFIQLAYRLGLAAGIYVPIGEMIVTTYTVTTVPDFFVAARLLSAVFGGLTALAVFGLGTRGWDRTVGLIAALFVALLPYHMQFSRWATTDVTATFLATLSLSLAFVAARDQRWRAYLAAGAFAGLAASAKYNAGAVAGAIAVAALLGMGRDIGQWRRLLVGQAGRLASAGIAAIVCFIAGTPYALLSPELVGGGIARQWTNYGGGNGHYRGEWNIAGYSEFFWGIGLGPLACLLILVGLAILARKRPLILAVWLGFALPSLLIHLSRPTHFMQNMLPLMVAGALPIGVAITSVPQLLAGLLPAPRRSAYLAPGLSLALLVLLLAPPALASGRELNRQAGGDSRQHVLAWIAAEVPPGARIAAELKPIPGVTENRWTEIDDLTLHDPAFYRSQGFAYLIGSSDRWGQFQLPEAYAMYGTPIAEFGPIRREDMLGPRLMVWLTGLQAGDIPQPLDSRVTFGGTELLGVAFGDPSGAGTPPLLREAPEFSAGGVFGLRTFWQVEEQFADDLLIFVHVLDAAGNRPTQRDAPPWQGRFPTSTWQAGTLVVDVNDVYLPPGMAPGEYRVMVGMYDPASGERPPVSRDGEIVPDGMVEVARFVVRVP